MADIKYVAFAVTDKNSEDDKSHWTRIGAAFENKDGSLSVLLDAVPTNGKLVLQTPKDAPAEEAA